MEELTGRARDAVAGRSRALAAARLVEAHLGTEGAVRRCVALAEALESGVPEGLLVEAYGSACQEDLRGVRSGSDGLVEELLGVYAERRRRVGEGWRV